MTDFTIVRKNLFRRPLRAFLMLIAVFMAFLIFGFLASFARSFYSQESVAASNRMITVNKINFTQPLPISYINKIRAIEGVQVASHNNWFGGYFQEPRNFIVTIAVEPESMLQVYDSDWVIPPDQRQAFLSTRTGALIGRQLAEKFGWKVGDRIPLTSNIFTNGSTGGRSWDLDIVAIYDPATELVDASALYFHFEYFNETRTIGKDFIGWVPLLTTDPARNDQIADQIDALFANSSFETSTDTEAAFNKAFAAQLGNIGLIVGLVSAAAFVTILMIVGNTMVMAVRERTKEIAVFKTLGFPSGRISRMVLGESVLIAFVGGIPGLLAAAGLCVLVRNFVANFAPGLAVSWEIALAGFILMLALGLITGLIPAMNALRLNIVTALGRA